jgi:2-methylcitrate dehydratase
MRPIENLIAEMVPQFRRRSLPADVLGEARKRVLDSLGCFYGAFDEKAIRALRKTFVELGNGNCALWGLERRATPATAALLNGAGVRALDYNDTYLSKEPCHPSDMISSLWAACETSERSDQGRVLLHAMVLSYDVLCRLCDAASLRTRGWDHVTYLPIATAAGCSYILKLTVEQTRHAIALAAVANNALRQTRVGTISDWKAACAAYAAQAGLNAALLARSGFTGPHDIFSGRHGFFAQVSGPFRFPTAGWGKHWRILDTHTKFFPAEHHAQSAIEAALALRPQLSARRIRQITVAGFDVATAIIGSEKEKWSPTTRETADHSLPYLVSIALLEGGVTLEQYQRARYLNADVKKLMRTVRVKSDARYTRLYPKQMPTRLTIQLADGKTLSAEVMRPKGYAGRPMSWDDVAEKFERLSSAALSERGRRRIVSRVEELERVKRLSSLRSMLRVRQ